jgi:hypothetical protein
VNKDEGLTSVRQSGISSKFKSCFGELPAIKKKAYKPLSDKKSRKRPVSFFNAQQQSSFMNHRDMTTPDDQ